MKENTGGVSLKKISSEDLKIISSEIKPKRLVIGIILSLLMLITLELTHIVTKQKQQIKTLTQEIAILKKEKKK